jgi:hypothetical protein
VLTSIADGIHQSERDFGVQVETFVTDELDAASVGIVDIGAGLPDAIRRQAANRARELRERVPTAGAAPATTAEAQRSAAVNRAQAVG